MAADGVSVVCATPHVRHDYPTTPAAMEEALALVREAAAADGIAIDVRGGGEIAIHRLPAFDPEERARFGLGGNPDVLLVETPYSMWPVDFARVCARLLEDGVLPVVAHPERNPDVMERPALVGDVVRAGAAVQITAGSIEGRVGGKVAACARQLIAYGFVHVIASDAHAPEVREAGLSAAMRAIGDPGLGRWLVEDAPAALLAGELLEERPGYTPPPRRWRFRRSGG